MANSIYTRLTGKRRGIASFSQLWIAPDHILLVRSSRITEHYQRFAFADIQGIVVTATPDRTVFQILAILAALGWAALLLTVTSAFGKGFFVATGALFLLLAILDIARGPRCRCTLYTAISQERLSPVSRQRVARKFLATIKPAIEAVQGAMPADRAAELSVSSPQFRVAPPRLEDVNHRAAWVFFSLLLLDSVLIWTGFRYTLSGGDGLLLTAYGAEVLLALMVLIQDRDNPLRIPYLLSAAALLCVVADAYGTLPDIARRIMLQATQTLQPSTVTLTSHISGRTQMFALTWRIVAGLAGLGTLLLTRPGKPVPAPPVPEPEPAQAEPAPPQPQETSPQ